jgi:hypothetical protein
MRFSAGFLFGAYWAGASLSRILFPLWVLFVTSCPYEKSGPLGRDSKVPRRCEPESRDFARNARMRGSGCCVARETQPSSLFPKIARWDGLFLAYTLSHH